MWVRGWIWRFVLAALIGAGVPAGHTPAFSDAGRQGWLPLEPGETVSGTLDDDSFRQVYTFDGQMNEVVAISMTRQSGDLDPYLLLTDEQGRILALSDDDGSSTNAQIEFKRIPASGRYFVIATRFGQDHGITGGDYTLLLERVGSGVTENTTLQYGDSVLGRITQQEPLVFYFMRARRGDVINITMRRTSGDLDPHLDLATGDGIVMISNDDDPNAAGTLDAGISNYTILEDGIYLVVATRFGREAGDTSGSYVLSISQTPVDALGTGLHNARLIDYGTTLQGAIDDENPFRYFQFDARRGDVITVTLTAESGNLDPAVKLLSTDFVEMAQDDDSGDGQDARLAAITLPESGMYTLIATRNREESGQTHGTFAIQLNGRPGVTGGRALEIMYGATVTGQLDDAKVSEEYVFFGREGDVVKIAMERASGDLDSLVTLYDSERKQIAFDDDSGDDKDALIQRFELPRDDMYILVASRYDREAGTTSGAYILSLELVRAGR